MKHCGTQTLETERLILRRFTVRDADAMYTNWAADPEVTRYLTWPAHAGVETSRAVLADWTAAYAQKSFYQWAIVLKDSADEPVGSIGAVDVSDDIAAVQIGYCLGRRWWHQGIMSEALGAVMDFFFDAVGCNRVACRHDPRNPHSGMVMQKCGMKYEGTQRSADRNNQGICDTSWYALLRAERPARKDARK
ncbi:MAG: GNAT family N-acetyltransferase [Oscillospiraceae bacterium]|nr:GNAT family N-acetyltransferase [Oscillospiraceae bacterium]